MFKSCLINIMKIVQFADGFLLNGTVQAYNTTDVTSDTHIKIKKRVKLNMDDFQHNIFKVFEIIL